MVFIRSLLNLGEFLITGNGVFVLVGVRFARKLFASIAEIEAEFAEVITGLRLVPRNGPVSCELWLYSRYGTLRHFRIRDAGLLEVDLYGTPLDQVKPVAAGSPPSGNETPALQGAAAPGPSVPGTADNRSPILRWLAKRNTARLAGKGVDTAESSELRKILDAGGPGTKTKRPSGKKQPGKNPAAAGPADTGKNSGAEKPVPEKSPATPDNPRLAQEDESRDGAPGSPDGSSGMGVT